MIIVVDEPVARRHVRDEVTACEDVSPETRLLERTREKCADADNGNRDLRHGFGKWLPAVYEVRGLGTYWNAEFGTGTP